MTCLPLLAAVVLASPIESVRLDATAWAVTSPARVLTAHEPMRSLVDQLESRDGAVLVIGHASGESDRARARALHAALVALGIPSSRARLEPAGAPPGVLVVGLEDGGKASP